MISKVLNTSTFVSTGERSTTLTNYLFYLFINGSGNQSFPEKMQSNPSVNTGEVFYD